MKSITELIADVKDRASVPADDERITNTLVTKLLNQCLDEYIYPTLLKISEEFNVVKTLVPLTTTAGTPAFPNSLIPLPKRAYGRVLREIKYFDNSQNLYNIPYVSLEDEDKFLAGSSYSAAPFGFYFVGDAIKLVGIDVSRLTGKLVLHYIIEANTLEQATTLYGPVYNIDYVGSEIRFWRDNTESLPEFEAYSLNSQTKLYDLYRKSSGAIIAADLPLTREIGALGYDYFKTTQLTVDNIQDLENFQDGGFPVTSAYESDLLLIPAGRSQFAAIPYELDNLLAQKVAGRVLEIIGDTEGLQVNDTRVRDIMMQVTSALGNRSRGESKKVVNRRSILRDLRRQYRRNW